MRLYGAISDVAAECRQIGALAIKHDAVASQLTDNPESRVVSIFI